MSGLNPVRLAFVLEGEARGVAVNVEVTAVFVIALGEAVAVKATGRLGEGVEDPCGLWGGLHPTANPARSNMR